MPCLNTNRNSNFLLITSCPTAPAKPFLSLSSAQRKPLLLLENTELKLLKHNQLTLADTTKLVFQPCSLPSCDNNRIYNQAFSKCGLFDKERHSLYSCYIIDWNVSFYGVGVFPWKMSVKWILLMDFTVNPFLMENET